jgi:DNA-binding Lrp family transcriptional regulator
MTKTESVKLDGKDLRIAERVIRDPRVTVEEIAEQLNQPVSTVQKRLADLLRKGQLERMIRIADWAAIGYPLRYRIDVKTDQRQLSIGQGGKSGEPPKIDSQKKLATYIMRTMPKGYSGLLIVQDVTLLFGQPDLCVTVRARDHQTVFDFVTVGLRLLGGVESTMTFHEVWSCADGDL